MKGVDKSTLKMADTCLNLSNCIIYQSHEVFATWSKGSFHEETWPGDFEVCIVQAHIRHTKLTGPFNWLWHSLNVSYMFTSCNKTGIANKECIIWILLHEELIVNVRVPNIWTSKVYSLYMFLKAIKNRIWLIFVRIS